MSDKGELIAAVVKAEWDMFQQVSNAGGRASCQDDPETFTIMRRSQFVAWSSACLESYRSDLAEAGRAGRNLLSEKYARMMQQTAPLDYQRIEHLLPTLDPAAPDLVGRIVPIALRWEEDVARRFPYVVSRGRPLHSSEDTPFATSLETYLRGELQTYSKRTLELYLGNLLDQEAANVNGAELVMENMAREYGYESLADADRRIRARAA